MKSRKVITDDSFYRTRFSGLDIGTDLPRGSLDSDLVEYQDATAVGNSNREHVTHTKPRKQDWR